VSVILVAEDEALIMMNIVDDLIEAGYDVLEARHAEEALNILGAVADGIHILFTDVRMPGEMDGIALCHHTKKHWPWIGLLATSAHPAPSADELPEGCRFLSKPYHRAHVIEHLAALKGAG
jgi:two-component system, response regulator PdtaR